MVGHSWDSTESQSSNDPCWLARLGFLARQTEVLLSSRRHIPRYSLVLRPRIALPPADSVARESQKLFHEPLGFVGQARPADSRRNCSTTGARACHSRSAQP